VNLSYRPEIDGLRAIAVIPVILFHAGFESFKGGFIGVDIFFVISGYLITRIINQEIHSGKFSLLNFYERRIRRIIPAFFCVMILTIPLAWFVLMPHQLKDYGESLVAGTFFAANFLFWIESGYFEAAAELKPLLHIWSLAIEEQFYIFYPLLFLAIIKIRGNFLVFVLIIIIAVSFLYGSFLYPNDQYARFYLLPTRAWELGLGCLCALVSVRHIDPRINASISFIGLLAVLSSFFIIDETAYFPSFLSLLPVVGTALFIVFSHSGQMLVSWISSKPFVTVGLVSYGAYLIHQPLLAFARVYFNSDLDILFKWLVIGVTFFLAVLLYRFVEKPFRNKNILKPSHLYIVSSIVGISLVSVGWMLHKNNGFLEYKLRSLDKGMAQYVIDIQDEQRRKFRLKGQYRGSSYRPFSDDPNTKKIMFLGDSISYDLYLAVKVNQDNFPSLEFRHQRLDDTCLKFLEHDQLPSYASQECKHFVPRLHQMQQYKNADEIVLSAVWQPQTVTHVLDAIRFFKKGGRRITVIGSANFNDLASLSYEIAKNGIRPSDFGAFFAANQRQDWKQQNERLKMILMSEDVRYLEKYDIFCHTENEELACPLYQDSQPLIYDTGHVTELGVYYFGRRVYEEGWFN